MVERKVRAVYIGGRVGSVCSGPCDVGFNAAAFMAYEGVGSSQASMLQ